MKKLLGFFLAVFILVSPALAAGGNTAVYITRTGECYHTGYCGYLSKSKIEITLSDAVSRGYRPCSRCGPPRLVEYTPQPTPRPTAAQAFPSGWRAQDDITAAYQAQQNAEAKQTATPKPTAKTDLPEKTKEDKIWDTVFIVMVLGGILFPLFEICFQEVAEKRKKK